MSFGAASGRERTGRPTQFHGVSYEERAKDNTGNTLPWALEYVEDSQEPRSNRRPVEEKGSFGRSTKRNKGSLRGATRTQTPAKKEAYPGLDGFEAALRYEAKKSISEQTQSQASHSGFTKDVPPAIPPARDSEPTQVMLYGFSSETQWAALQFFENASGGMICEDYDRNPPDDRRRYQGGLGLSAGPARLRRTLTKRESQMAMQYRGGECWIKITFDSKDAAERAVAAGPHLLQGFWVHATLWKGQPPARDEPIFMEEDDRLIGSLTGPRPARDSAGQLRRPSAAPQSPLLRSTPARNSSQQELAVEDSPISSTTATSATATAPDDGLRQRNAGERKEELSGSMKLFKNQRKTIVRPATEALLPTPTWTERFWAWLTQYGLVPGEVIGSTIPRLETGEFDWDTASYYWQIIRWLDDTLGTDLCGMKSD